MAKKILSFGGVVQIIDTEVAPTGVNTVPDSPRYDVPEADPEVDSNPKILAPGTVRVMLEDQENEAQCCDSSLRSFIFYPETVPTYRKPKLLVSPCGCLTIVDVRGLKLTVIDSNKMPYGERAIIGLLIDGDVYYIMESFLTNELLLSYLNSTFVLSAGQSGEYSEEDGFIVYELGEGETTETIEIMAIYQTYRRIIKVGDPEASGVEVVNIAEDDEDMIIVANPEEGEPLEVTSDKFHNVKITLVQIGNQLSEPKDDSGWKHDPAESETEGKFSLPADTVNNTYIYVHTKQIPATLMP